jgi:hypothetical protein
VIVTLPADAADLNFFGGGEFCDGTPFAFSCSEARNDVLSFSYHLIMLFNDTPLSPA